MFIFIQHNNLIHTCQRDYKQLKQASPAIFHYTCIFLVHSCLTYLNSDSSLRLLKSTDIKLSKNFLSPSAELSLVFCSNFNTSDCFRKKVSLKLAINT